MSDLLVLDHDHVVTYRHSAQIDGHYLTVTYAVDADEHARRHQSGVGAVADEKTLASMMELAPSGLSPVAPRYERAIQDASQRGAVIAIKDPVGSWWAQRCVEPAVSVLEIEIESVDWRQGSAVAHQWAGYAARSVVLERLPDDDRELVLTESSYYGIGVAIGSTRLLKPSEYRPRRWTSARWRLAEIVYGQYAHLMGVDA